MASVISTFDANESLAHQLHDHGAKPLARIVGASVRTVEKWLRGEVAPTWKHTSQMMRDDELLCDLLRAAGREDVAHLVEAKESVERAKRLLNGVKF